MAKKATPPPSPSPTPGRSAAGGIGGPPPPARVRNGHATLPWEEMLATYLSPILSEDGRLVRWRNLPEVADQFSCALQTVRETSAKDGWVKRQQLAKDIWASERTEAINKEMAQGAAVLRMAAYQNGVKLVNRATALLNNPTIDARAARDASFLNKDGLDTGLKCAGVSSVAQGANLGVMVSIQQNNGAPGAGPAGGGTAAANLWTALVEARRLTQPAQDPYDAPSPLPPSLASR